MASVFTKHNGAGYADALICEAEGLDSLRAALRDAGVFCIRVPEVRSVTLQYGWGGDNYIGLSPHPNRYLLGSSYLEGCRRGFSMVEQIAGHR